MPHDPGSNRPDTGAVPVPAAVLLPAASGHARPVRLPAGRLSVDAACRLIATYTRAGGKVADLDHDPHTAAAVRWLDQQLVQVDDTDPARPRADPARLVIARLPRPGVRGLAGTTGWMRHLREHLMVPGGYLLAVVVPGRRAGRYVDHATAVIAAAKAAGLIWQQQLLHIRASLPEPWPPTAGPLPAGGRHRRVHDDLYVFTTGGVDA